MARQWEACSGILPSVDRRTRSLECEDFLEGEHFTLSSALTLVFLVSQLLSLLVLLFVQDVVPEDQMKEEIMDSIQKGNFTMRILKDQLQNILKMGPVGQVMGMIPGFNNAMMPKVPHAPSNHDHRL